MTEPRRPDLDSIATTGDILRAAARRAPKRPAIVCRDRRITFAELDAEADRFARAVLARAAEPRPTVAIMCANRPEYAVVHFGAARTGGLLVHLSPRCAPAEAAHVLDLVRPRLLVVDAAAAAVVGPLLDGGAGGPVPIGVGEGTPRGIERFESFLAGHPARDPGVSVDPEAPFCVLFTGGTTGRPKGAVASHAARIASTAAAIEDHPLLEDDVVAVTTPLCHAAGLFTWFQPALAVGATAVLMPRWDPAALVESVAGHGVTGAFVVPAQLAMLLDDPAFAPERLAGLRTIVCGGAPLPAELRARTARALPGVDLVLAYGSTETGHLISQPPEVRRSKPDSLGRPGPRIEIAVFRAPGERARTGEVGEIATRGRHLFLGYLGEPAETAAYFRTGDGWGWTGDLGVIDGDGDLALVGRTKDIILSGGVSIHPAEIENAVREHPDVADCAAFGLPDPTWGELPAVAVVPRPGRAPTAAEIADFAGQRVARHKRPRRVEIVDALPRTPGGKVQRHRLRGRFAGAGPAEVAPQRGKR